MVTIRRWLHLVGFLFLFSFSVVLILGQEKEEETCEVKEDGSTICTPTSTSTNADNDKEKKNCEDNHEHCEYWLNNGECEHNPGYMYRFCPKSCNACDKDPSITYEKNYEDFARDKYGAIQVFHDDYVQETQATLEEMERYMEEASKDMDETAKEKLFAGCFNKHESCAYWAAQKECVKNPTYMKIHCAPACKSCDHVGVQERCPLDYGAPQAWPEPGDLYQCFANVTTLEKFAPYEPKVLSRPHYVPGDSKETADYKIGPWVVQLENFVTQEQAERLIELGHLAGFSHSAETGKVNIDGTYSSTLNESRRTSVTAWCMNDCYKDAIANDVAHRIADLVHIPETFQEYMQLLRYEAGQFYKLHHDYIESHANRQPGVRIMTVFLYLNDVHDGGETHFPHLNITVAPRRGRVLMWPSVRDDDPNVIDGRTQHEALTVEKGIKYAANAWVHRRDFKGPFHKNCH